MNNNELLKIKDKKEQFYMLRKEIIGDSCREEKIIIKIHLLGNLY